MFETAAADAIQQLTAAREQLAGLDPAALSRDELLEVLDALETDTRRQAAVSNTLIAELDGRGVAGELGYTGIGALLAERLRIGRREAAARARLAADLGARRALSGEKLAPRFPQIAAALAEGVDLDPARHGDHRHGRPDPGRGARPSSRSWPPRWNPPSSRTPAPWTRTGWRCWPVP